MALAMQQLFSRGNVQDMETLVDAPSHPLAVWRQGNHQPTDRTYRPGNVSYFIGIEAPHLLAGRHVPYSDHVIASGRGETLPVRRERKRLDSPLRSLHPTNCLA